MDEQHPGPPQPGPWAAPAALGPGPAGTPYGPPTPYAPTPSPFTPGGYGPPAVDHPSGTTILVLGILSLMVCPVTGIVAIVLGNRALKEIDANPAAYANRQSVVVGRVLGIVAVAVYGALAAVYLVFVLGLFAVFLGQAH